jgi:hypothetical protein
MGAWGYRNFENDDAMDFVGTMFEENAAASEIFTVVNTVADIVNKEDPGDGPEAYDASRALAGIEYIAAAKGNPSIDFPENAEEWLNKNTPLIIEQDIVALGRQAIQQIKENSELKELWEESKDYENWLAVLNDLEKRIA